MEMNNSALLLTPTPKKKQDFSREYPFPIVRNETNDPSSSSESWNCIIGFLQNDCVQVVDEDSMKMLFTMGFFGKGTLSRSAPKILQRNQKYQNISNKRKASESIDIEEEESVLNQTDDEEIEVVDCTDERKKGHFLRKRRKTDEVEVVLSDSSSSSEDQIELVAANSTIEQEETNISETLQLTFEEAYFLSYGLGCLVVKDKDQPLDLMRLWHKFCDMSPNQNFPVMYTAYHHFRSKGWIVRSGMKYGTDYVLYKDGPPFFHSTYAVIVKPLKEQNLRDITTGTRPNFTWSSLAAVNRICTHASKGLLLLYVIKPSTISENKISTPFCISQFKLEEVFFKRWVPAENREDDA